MLIALMLVCGLARRGAGGAFVTWGATKHGANNVAHGLGALLVGVTIASMSSIWLFPVFAALWFAATKPTPAACFRLIEEPLSLHNYSLAGLRMAYFLPLAALVYHIGNGSPLWFLMAFLLPLPYYVGMRLLKNGDKAVEFGEWGYGLIGLMLWGLM
jgi:hypothetical protein